MVLIPTLSSGFCSVKEVSTIQLHCGIFFENAAIYLIKPIPNIVIIVPGMEKI